MKKQPGFLTERVASAFQERSVVQAYQYRPVYPAETFEFLAGLLSKENKTVLDVGCGTGFVACHLVSLAERVDAVDISSEMIATGKSLLNGDHPNLHWYLGKAEDTFPQPPYGLITAGESLHWLDWEVGMPRFAEVLGLDGYLAILHPKVMPVPWDKDLKEIIRTYSTTRDFRSFDLIAELEQRQLFQRVGTNVTEAVIFKQALEEYIESFHGRASFSRERMSADNVAALDLTLHELVKPFAEDVVELSIVAEIVWGKPLMKS
jgi:SAM-dependent methyltransferase